MKSLTSGETFSLNPDHRFTSASLYKLFVLYAAEVRIAEGALDPAEALTLTAPVADADPYSDLQVATRISTACALRTMIEMSGNSAADLLVRRIGVANINSSIRAAALNDSAITSDGAYTSAADMATLLESIASHKVASSEASHRMLDLLSAQQHNDRIPAPLPLNARIAHKTGELPGLRHDVGIVFGPAGAYVLVVLVEDAPSASQARATITDVSAAVYVSLQHQSLPLVHGLSPRLALDAFRVVDASGRLQLLGDPRTQTDELVSEVQRSADAPSDLRLRPDLSTDLIDLQRAAAAAGTPFWIRSAFEQPTDAEAPFAVPTEWLLPCDVEQPPRAADHPAATADVAGAHARQAWLGTVVSVTDNEAGLPSTTDDRSTPAWRWLEQHSSEFGFAPALPETAADQASGHLPWTLRWLGRNMAQQLRPFGTPDFAVRAQAALARAEADLIAQLPPTSSAASPDLTVRCWTIVTNSTRGCPSRWYFLGLSLS